MSIKLKKGLVNMTRNGYERHIEEVEISKITIDPAENYRWGSQDYMELDLANNLETGENDAAMLKTSIRTQGVIEPILVDKNYKVFAGFTRLTLATQAKRKTIPAWVYTQDLTPEEIAILQLTENNQKLKRKENWVLKIQKISDTVTALEKAGDKDATATVAKHTGLVKSGIAKRIREFNRLPESVKQAGIDGRVSELCARTFVPNKDEKGYTEKEAEAIIQKASENVKAGVITPASIVEAIGNLKDSGDDVIRDKGETGQVKTIRPDAKTLSKFFETCGSDDMRTAYGIIQGKILIKKNGIDEKSQESFLKELALDSVLGSIEPEILTFKYVVEDEEGATKKMSGKKLLRDYRDELLAAKKVENKKGKLVNSTLELCIELLKSMGEEMRTELENSGEEIEDTSKPAKTEDVDEDEDDE